MIRSRNGKRWRGVGPAIGALLGALATACSPLGAFDRLVPKDRSGTLVARGLAYESAPRQRLDVYRRAAVAGCHDRSWCSSMAAAGTAGRARAMSSSAARWRHKGSLPSSRITDWCPSFAIRPSSRTAPLPCAG